MAADVLHQSRLLPSMLMTYYFGAGTTETEQHPPGEPSSIMATTSTKQQTDGTTNEFTCLTPSNARSPMAQTPHSAIGAALNLGSSSRSMTSTMLEEHDRASYRSSHGDISREGSFTSNTGRNKKRQSRPKTSYSLCHPPPKALARQKMHVRARPLLQLHKLAGSARPMPAFELLPSAIFSPSLSKAISKVFLAKHGLCPTDLAIVKADTYHQHEASSKEEDETRDVLALLCKGHSIQGGRSKIYLADGGEWEAYSLPSGGYEFATTDEHGLTTTVRWVVKRPRARRSQSASEMDSPRAEQLKKLNFSTISPNSRRHPVIASLTSATLDINDVYNMPAPAPASLCPSLEPPLSPDESAGQGETVETTEALQSIIMATAVWVALREGWCLGYRYDESVSRHPSSPSKANFSPTRASVEVAKDTSPKRSSSIVRVLRSASIRKRRSTASVPMDVSSEDGMPSRASSVHDHTRESRRPRAQSASTVIHHPFKPATSRQTTSSSHRFAAVDSGTDMTEHEEEEDLEDTLPIPTSRPKHMSAPPPAIPALDELPSGQSTPTPKSKRDSVLAAPARKRDSSIPPVAKALEEDHAVTPPRTGRKKSRSFRNLLCGIN